MIVFFFSMDDSNVCQPWSLTYSKFPLHHQISTIPWVTIEPHYHTWISKWTETIFVIVFYLERASWTEMFFINFLLSYLFLWWSNCSITLEVYNFYVESNPFMKNTLNIYLQKIMRYLRRKVSKYLDRGFCN
jgi:hypothetical protein